MVQHDVAASDWTARGIEDIDSHRKEIGTIIHIDNQITHPTTHFDLSGKMGVIPIGSQSHQFSICDADARSLYMK